MSITVTPALQTIRKGVQFQLTAIGTFDDGSTDLATWESSAPSVAAMNPAVPGQAIRKGAGTAIITAKFAELAVSATLEIKSR